MMILQRRKLKILKWFISHEVTTSPIPNIDLSPEGTRSQEETLRSFATNNQDIPKGRKRYQMLNYKKEKTVVKPEAKNRPKYS